MLVFRERAVKIKRLTPSWIRSFFTTLRRNKDVTLSYKKFLCQLIESRLTLLLEEIRARSNVARAKWIVEMIGVKDYSASAHTAHREREKECKLCCWLLIAPASGHLILSNLQIRSNVILLKELYNTIEERSSWSIWTLSHFCRGRISWRVTRKTVHCVWFIHVSITQPMKIVPTNKYPALYYNMYHSVLKVKLVRFGKP